MRTAPLLIVVSLLLIVIKVGALTAANEPSELAALSQQFRSALRTAEPSCFALIDSDPDNKRVRTATLVTKSLLITDARNLIGLPKYVTLIDHKGQRHLGETVGQDLRLRVAGIRLMNKDKSTKELPGVIGRTKEVKPGRFAFPCGRGEALQGLPMGTQGVISARWRFSGRAVQISADLNPGLAGGPVVDLDGKAYGVSILLPSKVNEDSGVSFLVPWRVLEPVLEPIAAGKTLYPASLGLLVPEQDVVGVTGVPVVDVRRPGPAFDAGLRKGDILLKVGDRPLEGVTHLSERVSRLYAGQSVTLTVLKASGETKVLEVKAQRRDR